MRSIPPHLALSALDAAPDAMLIIDAAGIVRFANIQVSVLFGRPHDDIVGQSVDMLMPERFRVRHGQHRAQYLEEGRVRPMGRGLDLYGLRSDGGEFPVEISLSPVKDGDATLVAAAIRDVTSQKWAEGELIVARDAAEGARRLADEARHSADRANLAKSRFLATASHDLRQPLQTLALLNGTLRRSIVEPGAAEVLLQQEQTIGAMSRLLNTLLDISKLESGAIKPEPSDFTVAALFDELRAEFAGLAANKGLRLEIEQCADRVHSDPSLVEQILRNLIANAIKFTRDGWVTMRCFREAAMVRIEILDTGIGISADQLPFICDEFYQVGVAANSSRDGFGLGLSIVQRLVKLLTLKMDVHSEVGKGSTFSLTLPASSSQSIPPAWRRAQTITDGAKLGGARVLVVEDNEHVRRATHMLLSQEGYDVVAVASLASALQHVRDGNGIDMLVTDYHLNDGETGTQVIAALRSATGLSLKAVLTTGDTSTAIAELARDPYLRIMSKPYTAEALLASLRALLAA